MTHRLRMLLTRFAMFMAMFVSGAMLVSGAMFVYGASAEEPAGQHAADGAVAAEAAANDHSANDHAPDAYHDDKHHDGKHHDGKHHDGEHHDGKHEPGRHGTDAATTHSSDHAVPSQDHVKSAGRAAAAGMATANAIDSADLPQIGEVESLEPYKLLRSLQFVQDAVVSGDHSAMEMQRYLLGVIDGRLRQADQKIFDDPRNVDAALVYAMSGGNPETLDILAMKDKFGNFDNEITTVLRAYLNGRAAKTKTTLVEVIEIYRDTEIGPYLTLIAANIMAAMNDDSALGLFDWARLIAPGTLIEEAALRRSLFITARKNMVDEAVHYAQLYARRFINSPYAGQYADLLVDLVVLNYGKVGDEKLRAILTFMDKPRKREVYLRVARKAAISGLRDLAMFASDRAEELITPSDKRPKALAELYSGMARVPTEGVDAVLASLKAVPTAQLSRRDRALRQAAQMVAAEMMRKPDLNSLTQVSSAKVNAPDAKNGEMDIQPETGAESGKPDMDLLAASRGEADAVDEVFEGYVSDKKKTLERIDEMLMGVEKEQGS